MMGHNVEDYIVDSRLAFIQGKYEETLKLAKQAFRGSILVLCAGAKEKSMWEWKLLWV